MLSMAGAVLVAFAALVTAEDAGGGGTTPPAETAATPDVDAPSPPTLVDPRLHAPDEPSPATAPAPTGTVTQAPSTVPVHITPPAPSGAHHVSAAPWPRVLAAWWLSHAASIALVMGLVSVSVSMVAWGALTQGFAWVVCYFIPFVPPVVVVSSLALGLVVGSAWTGLPSAAATWMALRGALAERGSWPILGLASLRALVSAVAVGVAVAVGAAVLGVLGPWLAFRLGFFQPWFLPGQDFQRRDPAGEETANNAAPALVLAMAGCGAVQVMACVAQGVLVPAEALLLVRGTFHRRQDGLELEETGQGRTETRAVP